MREEDERERERERGDENREEWCLFRLKSIGICDDKCHRK